MLWQMKGIFLRDTIPTVTVGIEIIVHKQTLFKVYDFGSQSTIKPSHYGFQGQLIVFFIDSTR